jgi:hypothetical protein
LTIPACDKFKFKKNILIFNVIISPLFVIIITNRNIFFFFLLNFFYFSLKKFNKLNKEIEFIVNLQFYYLIIIGLIILIMIFIICKTVYSNKLPENLIVK